MSNRYEQVLLTYLRQWQFWAYLAAWIAVFPVLATLPTWWGRQFMVFIFLSFAATGPAAVIGHAKQQLADARASLTPGFRTPHVIVAVAWLFAVIGLMPLLTHAALDVPLLGLTASVAVTSVGFALLAYFQSLAAVAVSCAGVALLLFTGIREAGELMLFGGFDRLAVIVLAGSVMALAAIFYRLATLHEGMSEYGRIFGDRSAYAWSDARTVPHRERMPREPSMLTRLQLAAADRRLRAVGSIFAAGPWRRVRHWMLSGELSSTKWAAAALLAAFLTTLPLWAEGGGAANYGSIVAIGALMSVLMPVFCVTATWMSRRRSMGYELIRPASRERFVREFGLAVATDLAEWWLWLTAAAIVPLLVWGAQQRAGGWGAADLLAMLALSAAEQVLAFGILVSILRVRSPRASDGSIMTSIIVVIAPVLLTITFPRTPGMTLAIAAGVAALGAALTYDAYRRWCETDLA